MATRKGPAIFLFSAIVLVVSIAGPSSPAVADAAVRETSAYQVYIQQNLKLLQSGDAPLSVDTLLAQRRLQDDFCRKAAQCEAGPDSNSTPYRAAFYRCLGEEAADAYGLSAPGDQQ
jgi:hypothetical protein